MGAAWILMQIPTIGERRLVVQHRKKARAAAKAGRVADVGIVDLRRLLNTGPGESASAGEGRAFHHRWKVRGHWRMQRKGPGLSVIEPKYIEGYTKGPDGAPYLTRDRVFTWRR